MESDERNKTRITYYAYDRMGNTISSGNSTMMTYDYERRLTAITLPSGDTVTYKYLPDGTRIMRANSTETEYYLYDREDRIGDYDENGNLMIAYTHGPGMDEPVALNINGSTYFYIPDIQGSIKAIVDIDGNAKATYVYDVWGNLISHNGPLSERNDYLYTGREYDWETGIYYYRARSYNPEIGRFLQQDPEGMVDGPNMYAYVRNDPGNSVDPTGKWVMLCCEWGWKTEHSLELDEDGFVQCLTDKYGGGSGFSTIVIQSLPVCLPSLTLGIEAFASCMGAVLAIAAAVAIYCTVTNVHWVSHRVYTCIRKCPSGGRNIGVPIGGPGPWPPVVGPLPI